MDTIINKIDTIVYKIIQDENIYDTILTEQHETYEILMFSFLGIMGLVLGLSLFLNFYYFNKRIEGIIDEKKREIKIELTEELHTNLSQSFNSNQSEFEKIINTKYEELKSEYFTTKNDMQASVLHVQGNFHQINKYYETAFEDFIEAGKFYTKSQSKANLRRILQGISNGCLPNLNKSNIENLEKYHDFKINEFLKEIGDANEKGELSDSIYEIRKEYDLAKNREKKEN